jgi:hypothetical protein
MKPNFALSLSFDGIRLLHRAAGGWTLVGEVPVDAPDLDARLRKLRRAGAQVKTRPIRSQVIVPDSQIKYLSLNTGPMDDDARRDAARAALEGATPYAVSELVFDISPDSDTTHVAAVARETLTEAEAFAVEHRFNPVCFVANPDGEAFLGAPYFGETTQARTLLPEGVQVEPDRVRILVLENTESQANVTEPSVPPVQDAKPDKSEKEANAELDAPSSDNDDADRSIAAPDTRKQAAPVPDQPAVSKKDASQPVRTMPVPERPPAAPTAAATASAENDGDTALQVAEPPIDVDLTPEPETEPPTTPPLLGFATRRRQTPSTTLSPLGGVTRTPPKGRPVTMPPRGRSDADVSDLLPESEQPLPLPKTAAASFREAPLPPEAVTPPDTAKPAAAKGGFLSRRKKQDRKAASRKTAASNTGGVATAAPEAHRMTVFGERQGATVAGKPRFLGLVLTVLLLILLAGVAAWASVFLDEGLARLFPGRERTLASTLPDDARAALAEDVGVTTLDVPDEEAADEEVVASLNDSLSDGLTAEDSAVLDALRNPLPEPVAPAELDIGELEARYAVTGIWWQAPVVPPEPATLIDIEDLYVTSIDPISPALDAVALPGAPSYLTDSTLAVVTSPVAPGTQFARGTDGRIVPTVEGALSPDGFTVYLGPPPALPPPALLARTESADVVEPPASIVTLVRPRPRPTDLVEQNERATLGGLSRSELAALRPRLRPAAPQELESVQPEANADADVPEPVLAAMTTLRPNTRPGNFARIVARAERAAPAPAPAAAVRTAAAVAPRVVAPSIPSSASVARAATVNNAIKLNRINLIGVYGTPSNRRALVRLSNGRYKKVQVGDRFDGGRISAIGDSELRYKKGSRNVVLKMPQG